VAWVAAEATRLPTRSAGMRVGHYGAPITIRDGLLGAGPPQVRLAAAIAAVFHASSRRDNCSHAATRVIRRNTNRRHIIDDPHGRTAGGTTLLVRGLGEIFGTHRVIDPSSCGGRTRIDVARR
jgi:hypothetical protein